MTFSVRPLTDTFGVEIENIDISGPLSTADFKEVRDLWHQHELLLFRNQSLVETDMIEFSRRFGELEIHVREEWLSDDNPEILMVTNIKKNGQSVGALEDAEVGWHYDQIYLPQPAVGSMLSSVKLPPDGGSTYFADMSTAYETLPKHLHEAINGRSAVQSYSAFNQSYSTETNDTQTKKTQDVEHPIVRTHPFTGRKALYICPGMSIQIVGLPEDESKHVLEECFAWSIKPEFVYQHDWQLGDSLLWDNACTMHRRDPFDGDQFQRIMKRTTILPPVELAVPF
jgi:taurine dioxygenase